MKVICHGLTNVLQPPLELFNHTRYPISNSSFFYRESLSMQKPALFTFAAALAVGAYLAYQRSSPKDSGSSNATEKTTQAPLTEPYAPPEDHPQTAQSGMKPNPQNTDSSENTLQQTIENGEAPGTSEFTRASFFEPFDWGANLSATASPQPQQLNFSESCKTHNRFNPELRPEQWANQFTQTDALQRWPSGNAHVIDWNQFWKLGETGFQISIRWNFEVPALYRVVVYSFSMNSPDGYGAEALPEKNQVTWAFAKQYVQAWENEMLTQGGVAGTRTMTLSAQPFNPADVSPEDIERAEYLNTRIRCAQTGRMSCNTLYNNSEMLSCRCF